jgi:hypothetical protein
LGSKKHTDRGQATIEFALTLPLLFLFSLCLVQVGSVANDQLVLNHAAQTAARAISLADINPESAQQVAIATVEREINLREIQVEVKLENESLRYERRLAVPVIGQLFRRFSLTSSATMPRQLLSTES